MEASGMETPKKSNRGLWIGLGVGCLVLLLCAAVGAVLFGGTVVAFFGELLSSAESGSSVIGNALPGGLDELQSGIDEMDNAFAEPTGIQIGVIGPGTVTVGESFNLLVRVTNTSAESQTLDSIDFGEEYLAGVSVLSADPGYSDSFPYPGFVSYTFERSIPAGGEVAVQFRMQADESGDYEGPLDICINSPVNCLRETVSTSVSP